MTARMRRRAARAVYRISGKLGRIKTRQRMYALDGTPLGRRRTRCAASLRLLGLAMQLDWDHFDHWAAKHDDCGGHPCAVCGGTDCDETRAVA